MAIAKGVLDSPIRWIPLCSAHEVRRDFRDIVVEAGRSGSIAELLPCPGDFPLDALWSRNLLPEHELAIARLAPRESGVRSIVLVASSAIEEVLRELSPADDLSANARHLAAAGTLRFAEYRFVPFDDRRRPCLGWVGEWSETSSLLDRLGRLASETLPVLILGESGTGKELVARGLHVFGRRRDRPYLAINCAELPESVLESELFGHTRGAFTGATADRPGLFESAGDGTVFLDEIGELPLAAQAKLLRVLEEHRVRRIGAAMPRPLSCRILAATNRELTREIAHGRFRADLYYRLRGSELGLRPLRDRRRDILPLAELFAARAALRFRKRPVDLSADAHLALLAHEWPGNIRELRHTIDVAVLGAAGSTLGAAELSIAAPLGETPVAIEPLLSVSAVERAHIVRALTSTAGNKMAAARILGLTRQSLQRRMIRHGIALPSANGRLQPPSATGNGFGSFAANGFPKPAS